MAVSLHSVATLSILPRFKGLKAALEQGETYCTERKVDPSVLLNARLFPDMGSLIKQVQLSSDHAKGAFYRTAGLVGPSRPIPSRLLRDCTPASTGRSSSSTP